MPAVQTWIWKTPPT